MTAAAAAVAPNIPDDLRPSIVNAPGAESYPISGFTWMLVYQKQTDKAKATALTRMLWWAVTDGQQFNEAAALRDNPARDGRQVPGHDQEDHRQRRARLPRQVSPNGG